MIKETARELSYFVEDTAEKLKLLNKDFVSKKPAPNKWSIKEILGHLIDSAVNNHHRFVRAQAVDNFEFPDYTQDFWVSVQSYNEVPWDKMVELWRLYNLLLAHIIFYVNKEKLKVKCIIGNNNAITLETLISEYLPHMKHHLKQIEERISAVS